jgi:hypothetical protein
MVVSKIDNNGVNLGQLGNRNLIINPIMAVAQRADRAAAGYTTPFYAGPDRWLVARSGTGSTGFSRQANTGFGGTYAAQATFTSAAGESWNVQQRIESANIAHLAGQDVTLSFYVAGASAAGSSTMFAALNYANSVDDFSADTEIANFSVAYSGTITKFTFTFTLPASAVNGVSVVLRGVKTDATGIFTLTFGGVQLEAGDTATPLEHRSVGQELGLCQRYYEKSFPQGQAPVKAIGSSDRFGGIAYSASSIGFAGYFSVSKRTSPTMVLYQGSNVAGGSASGTVNVYISEAWSEKTVSGTVPRSSTFQFDCTGLTLTSGYTYILDFHWTADAEL